MTLHVYTERFPATREQVRAAHTAVGRILDPLRHPRADDAVLLTCELSANAVLHSNSRRVDTHGQPGTFTLALAHTPAWVHVAVADAGSPTPPCTCKTRPVPEVDPEGGRGLLLVEALSSRWGYTRLPGASTVVWADLGARPAFSCVDLARLGLVAPPDGTAPAVLSAPASEAAAGAARTAAGVGVYGWLAHHMLTSLN